MVAAVTTIAHCANCAVLGSCGVNCSDKFQQFLIGCERPCDPAAKTILGARCSVRQWIHVLRQKGRLLEEILVFYVNGYIDDDDVPRLSGKIN